MEFYMNAYGFENEGQLLAGALISPPKYYENRHDMSNLMALVEFEVQWIFRDLQKKFFEEFGGKPKDNIFTDEMLQKASAWYMVTYSKNEASSTHFFGLPWAVADVLVQLKMQNFNPDVMRPSKSLLEETIDKAVSKHFKMLGPDADCEEIYENRILVLDVAYKILTRWIKSQKEYFSDPDLKKVHKYLSNVFDNLTSDLISGGVHYITKLKEDGKIKRAISPAHNVIESILRVAKLGVLTDLSDDEHQRDSFVFDVRQEFGLLAWITLVKLACSYNPQYLAIPNLKGEYASTVFYKNQDNVIDVLQLPLFERKNEKSTEFSIKITHEVEEVKQYLKEQTKLKDIDFRIIPKRDGDDYVRITAKGTRYSIERLKDIVVMKDFLDAVVSNKPLLF
ncbi:RNA-dependent RNA polymerase [Caerostris extrusa]|uniref:RNA-dependent RNA polymerase n=1 Tax=Caerostris extrusa TaxID=172846 RepID=A0AAV4TEP4_CAEEX|nr:RNA-dependent RNA polymerase [Caerostris extrusa]